MHSLHDRGLSFVLDQVQSAPVQVRIDIYRWLAEVGGTPERTKEFTRMADELEAAERRFAEFHFKFRQQLLKGGAQ